MNENPLKHWNFHMSCRIFIFCLATPGSLSGAEVPIVEISMWWRKWLSCAGAGPLRDGAATSLARPGVRERARGRDLAMAQARAELHWVGQFKAAINPVRARQIRHMRGIF